MRTLTKIVPAATLVLLSAATAWGATLSGTVRVGNLFLDETGDRSAVQESYDLYEGFVISRIQLTGVTGTRNTLQLDLRDINRPSRTGDLVFRAPGAFKLTAAWDQNRYVFDPGRGITSERKDWRIGMQATAAPWLSFTGDVGRTTREGERIAYPPGTVSALGDAYDDAVLSGQLTADVRQGAHGGGLSFRMTDYTDDLRPFADRRGMVLAARLHTPMPFWPAWTNLVRASYGTRRLDDGGLEHTLYTLNYTAVLRPQPAWEMRYAFDATRLEDDALGFTTDRFQNDLDAIWFHARGSLNAGYGYEMNDDDRRLTSYHSWRAGAVFRPDRRLTARADYAGRVKKDQEELTLLKDIEASRIRAKLDVRPIEALTLGGDWTRREREMPDIGVTADGDVAGAFARWDVRGWGALTTDYNHADEEYVDLIGSFGTVSDVVTARVDVDRIRNLRLAGGVTYLNIEGDLEIEKSIVFAEGSLTLARRWHLDVKYDCFNYDDYILITRYYTANVVRVDVGYDL